MNTYRKHSNQQNVSIHLYPTWGTRRTYLITERKVFALDFSLVRIILAS
jgi:hypothetical protein